MNLSRGSMYTIKEESREICPALVLALAAKEGVVLAGDPFYLLYTGRRDGRLAFVDITTFELPSPIAELSKTLATFASTGIDLREFMTLLGGHGIAVLRCKFFGNRRNLQTAKCRNISSTIQTPSGSASYVDFPWPSADFDGSDFTSSAPSVLFFPRIANICGAVNYFIPSTGVIWYTSGVSSNGGSGSGLNPGSDCVFKLRGSMYTIKEDRGEICPGLVLALAAKEGVVLAGDPFYLLYNGRRDSRLAFAVTATFELPSPIAELSKTLATFASTGIDLREFVTLLGGRGIAVLRCKFFGNHRNLQTAKCRNISSTIQTPSGSASYVVFPWPSADFDGSDFTSSAPPVLFFPRIANICEAANYFMPYTGVIWYTSGVASNGGSGSGLNPGSNRIIGKKRDRPPDCESLEDQPPRKKRRLDEGRLHDISIDAALLECASLSPDDPPVNSFFDYDLEAKCARCGYGMRQRMHWSRNRDFNSICGACGCPISIQLAERGEEALTAEAADHWVRIVSFRSWNLQNFKYHMEGGIWRVRKQDGTEYTFMLTEQHRMPVPAAMLQEVNSHYFLYQRREPYNVNLVFEVCGLRAVITERVEQIGGLAARAA